MIDIGTYVLLRSTKLKNNSQRSYVVIVVYSSLLTYNSTQAANFIFTSTILRICSKFFSLVDRKSDKTMQPVGFFFKLPLDIVLWKIESFYVGFTYTIICLLVLVKTKFSTMQNSTLAANFILSYLRNFSKNYF